MEEGDVEGMINNSVDPVKDEIDKIKKELKELKHQIAIINEKTNKITEYANILPSNPFTMNITDMILSIWNIVMIFKS